MESGLELESMPSPAVTLDFRIQKGWSLDPRKAIRCPAPGTPEEEECTFQSSGNAQEEVGTVGAAGSGFDYSEEPFTKIIAPPTHRCQRNFSLPDLPRPSLLGLVLVDLSLTPEKISTDLLIVLDVLRIERKLGHVIRRDLETSLEPHDGVP